MARTCINKCSHVTIGYCDHGSTWTQLLFVTGLPWQLGRVLEVPGILPFPMVLSFPSMDKVKEARQLKVLRTDKETQNIPNSARVRLDYHITSCREGSQQNKQTFESHKRHGVNQLQMTTPSNAVHRTSNVKQSNITDMNYMHSTHKESARENNQTVHKATNHIQRFLSLVI